ncbi:envelope glycoprotein, partial [Striga asiatica]
MQPMIRKGCGDKNWKNQNSNRSNSRLMETVHQSGGSEGSGLGINKRQSSLNNWRAKKQRLAQSASSISSTDAAVRRNLSSDAQSSIVQPGLVTTSNVGFVDDPGSFYKGYLFPLHPSLHGPQAPTVTSPPDTRAPPTTVSTSSSSLATPHPSHCRRFKYFYVSNLLHKEKIRQGMARGSDPQ